MSGQINVVIAEDNRLIRESLREILNGEDNIQIVGEATNGPETIDVVSKFKPDIVLLDIFMPDMNGLELIQPIREKSPDTKTLILAPDMDEATLSETLKAGAKGCISKDVSIFDLIKAIESVHEGELWVERKQISRFFEEEVVGVSGEEERPKTTDEQLTPREQEVLRFLTTGAKNKEIADALFISEKTVKTHLSSIFRKLNVTRRLEAILYALNKGLK